MQCIMGKNIFHTEWLHTHLKQYNTCTLYLGELLVFFFHFYIAIQFHGLTV